MKLIQHMYELPRKISHNHFWVSTYAYRGSDLVIHHDMALWSFMIVVVTNQGSQV